MCGVSVLIPLGGGSTRFMFKFSLYTGTLCYTTNLKLKIPAGNLLEEETVRRKKDKEKRLKAGAGLQHKEGEQKLGTRTLDSFWGKRTRYSTSFPVKQGKQKVVRAACVRVCFHLQQKRVQWHLMVRTHLPC